LEKSWRRAGNRLEVPRNRRLLLLKFRDPTGIAPSWTESTDANERGSGAEASGIKQGRPQRELKALPRERITRKKSRIVSRAA